MNYENQIKDLGERIQLDLLGMVQSYYAKQVSKEEVEKTIEEYDKKYNIRRQITLNDLTNEIYREGIREDGERVYRLPIL